MSNNSIEVNGNNCEEISTFMSMFAAEMLSKYPSKSSTGDPPNCCLILTADCFSDKHLADILLQYGQETLDDVVKHKPFMELFTKRTGRQMFLVMAPRLGNCLPDCLSAAELLLSKGGSWRSHNEMRVALVKAVVEELENPDTVFVEHFRHAMDSRQKLYKKYSYDFNSQNVSREGYQLCKTAAIKYYQKTAVKNKIWLDAHTIAKAPQIVGVAKITVLMPLVHYEAVVDMNDLEHNEHVTETLGSDTIEVDNLNHNWSEFESNVEGADKRDVFLGFMDECHFCLGMCAEDVLA